MMRGIDSATKPAAARMMRPMMPLGSESTMLLNASNASRMLSSMTHLSRQIVPSRAGTPENLGGGLPPDIARGRWQQPLRG